jgi:Heavy metal binding domain
MSRVAAAVLLAAALAGPAGLPGQPSTDGRVAVRFHHLHYRVPDPGALLRQASTDLQGTRAIVQGVGIGVRVGREYVLFERETATAAPGRRREPAAAFDEAVRWLAARGVSVLPERFDRTLVAKGLPVETLDHVGFATNDVNAAVVAIKDKPIATAEEFARFKTRSGLVVEIVRDTDRPDAFWCPMHPDVRSPGEGKCPICSMALVPIPPPRLGEYRMNVAMTARPGGGASALTFTIYEPSGDAQVSDLLDVHERPFHLFIISRDLATFAHVHPERQPDGAYRVTHDLPPGQYVLLADFLPVGGTSQFVHKAIITPGFSRPLFDMPPEIAPIGTEQVVGGLRIRMDAPSPAPRREAVVRFEVSDAQTGKPVMDLEPYLGASGHLLIVNRDLTLAMHAHPEGSTTAGPAIAFGPVFPAPGRYKLWVQVQRKGEVMTAAFVIEVPSDLK